MNLFDRQNMDHTHPSTRSILELSQRGTTDHDYSVLIDDMQKIHQSIEVLRSLIPQVINDEVINQIYSRTSYQDQPKLQQNDQLNYSQFQCEDLNFQDEIIEDSRHVEQQDRIVAQNFCTYGYGYAFMRHQKPYRAKIDARKYEDAIFRIILTALQHLESFLVDEGKVGVRSSGGELESIYSTIIHDSKRLPPEIRDILRNVMKGLQQIMPYDSVTREEAHILYKALKRTTKADFQQHQTLIVSSKQRFKQMLGDSVRVEQPASKKRRRQRKKEGRQEGSVVAKEREEKYELHRRWVAAYEQLLLALYRKTANISHIRDRFQVVFPQDSPIFTVQALRSKLFKILRAAIKKLQQCCKQSSNGKMTPLMRLDDSRVKTIINNCDFRKVRLLILDVYSQNFDLRLLNETVNRINMFVSQMQDQPRSVKPPSKTDDRNSQIDIPFYHPLNTLPPKPKENRLKYNRQYTPPASAIQKDQQLQPPPKTQQ